jgi:hypothetical protein
MEGERIEEPVLRPVEMILLEDLAPVVADVVADDDSRDVGRTERDEVFLDRRFAGDPR